MKYIGEKGQIFLFSFFFLSIGENRNCLFYKHWLLKEGRKGKFFLSSEENESIEREHSKERKRLKQRRE